MGADVDLHSAFLETLRSSGLASGGSGPDAGDPPGYHHLTFLEKMIFTKERSVSLERDTPGA